MAFSKSGKYLAYCISKSGSDWSTIYFRETSKPFITASPDEKSASTGGPDRLDDVVEFLKYSGPTWTHDDKGVFYKRFPTPKIKKRDQVDNEVKDQDEAEIDHGTLTNASEHAEMFYHRLGTNQKDDILVISKDEKIATSMYHPQISE